LILAVLPMKANDGSYFTSGNHLVPLQETHISVKKEILTIHIGDDGYANVDVYYEFYNPGNDYKTIQMGFEADPPYNADYTFYPDGKHPYINNFTVEMNSKTLTYQNAVALPNIGGGMKTINLNKWKYDENEADCQLKNVNTGEYTQFAYVYYFDATFKPGINKIHHTYSYQLSVVVGTSWLLNYKLSPAGRWANKRIDDFTLVIDAKNTAKHFIISKNIFGKENHFVKKSGEYKIRTLPQGLYTTEEDWEIALRNGVIEMHIKNFTPNEENELSIASADSYYSFNSPDNKYHYGAFYDRSTSAYVYMADNTENVVPSDKNFRQRICRNLPFAHRGHVFKDKQLKSFFEKQFWYMPNPNYKDDTSNFTESDKNVMKHKIGVFDD